MATRISHDTNAPTASVELAIMQPLADYDLKEVAAPTPREIDPILASQGFKDLLDEARGILEKELHGGNLEIAQLTGAICHDGNAHRPGLWLVLRERNTHGAMSEAARERVAQIAEAIRKNLQLS